MFLATGFMIMFQRIARKYGLDPSALAEVVGRIKTAMSEPVRQKDDPLLTFFRNIEECYCLALDEASGVRATLIRERADFNDMEPEEAEAAVDSDIEALSRIFTELTWLDDGWCRRGDAKIGYAVTILAEFWLQAKGTIPERSRNKPHPESDRGLLFLCDVIECALENVRPFHDEFEKGFAGDEGQKQTLEELRTKISNHLKREGLRLRRFSSPGSPASL